MVTNNATHFVEIFSQKEDGSYSILLHSSVTSLSIYMCFDPTYFADFLRCFFGKEKVLPKLHIFEYF